MKEVLYITYDGLTDQLGQSQVLPYIINLSKFGYSYKIISFEKPDKYEKNKHVIESIIKDHPIEWYPEKFTSTVPLLSKLYDLKQMVKSAKNICNNNNISLIHCRSYQAAYTAMKIKKEIKTPYLFDMRGFWVDERIDGGIWNKKNPMYQSIYKKLKKVEQDLVHHSDAIISLTEAGKTEIQSWEKYNNNPILVIPCSVDLELFKIPTEKQKSASREELGFTKNDFVISYLGSLGTWYLLDEMLSFFAELKLTKPSAKFLFITNSPEEMILEHAHKFELDKSDFKILYSSRDKVPYYLGASDMSIFFIKQAYSKIASSPTKLGELLVMGIPVICNDKVGDVKEIIEQMQGGIVIEDFNKQEYRDAIQKIDSSITQDPVEIRKRSTDYYDLNNAIKTYLKSYQTILQ